MSGENKFTGFGGDRSDQQWTYERQPKWAGMFFLKVGRAALGADRCGASPHRQGNRRKERAISFDRDWFTLVAIARGGHSDRMMRIIRTIRRMGGAFGADLAALRFLARIRQHAGDAENRADTENPQSKQIGQNLIHQLLL